MVNPFQVTKPVSPSEVIDRDKETERLVELAYEANNARVVAPRRYGKTSVLRRVQNQLDNEGSFIPVYVDLLGIVSADDFSARLERAYTTQLKGKFAQWWAGVRRQLRPSVSAGGGPVPASLSFDLSGPSRETLLERLDLPLKVRDKTGMRVHIVFDEFQELERLAQSNIDQILRSSIQHHDDAASYVFAGSELHMMEMMFTDPQRAFFGQAQRVALSPLADGALGGYISSRFENTDKTVTGDALGALLGLVLGHPQRGMVAAHALWRVTEDVADLGEWETARSDFMQEVDDELRVRWMETNTAEREILVLLASGRSVFSRAGGARRGGGATRAVETLSARGVIAQGVNKDRYIVDPLFGEWIRAQRGPTEIAILS